MKVGEVERFEGLLERRCERFRVRHTVRGRTVMVGEVFFVYYKSIKLEV
jgi:hypothetical protein